MTKILVMEDEASIRSFILVNLKKNGFEVVEAGSGEEALGKLDNTVDLALMDVMLPGISGFEVCKRAREQYPSLGIIMLTAKGQEENKIEGLELGADDYVVKPFDMKELVARIKAVSRRFQNADNPDKELVFPGLTININQYTVKYMGRELEMPPKELELLYFLASHPGMVFTREQLLEQVWGYDYFGDSRTVDVHVKRLREKLSGGESMGWLIKTVWGVGYKFEVKSA